MLGCAALAPFLYLIPPVAASGALVWVGLKLCPSFGELRTYSRIDVVALVLMQAAVVATFTLDRAMLVGLSSHIVAALLNRQKVNPYLVGSTFLLALGAVLQF
jgi:adenine/guanine/hypoxanthine permease